jgi:hypothetical protein
MGLDCLLALPRYFSIYLGTGNHSVFIFLFSPLNTFSIFNFQEVFNFILMFPFTLPACMLHELSDFIHRSISTQLAIAVPVDYIIKFNFSRSLLMLSAYRHKRSGFVGSLSSP